MNDVLSQNQKSFLFPPSPVKTPLTLTLKKKCTRYCILYSVTLYSIQNKRDWGGEIPLPTTASRLSRKNEASFRLLKPPARTLRSPLSSPNPRSEVPGASSPQLDMEIESTRRASFTLSLALPTGLPSNVYPHISRDRDLTAGQPSRPFTYMPNLIEQCF